MSRSRHIPKLFITNQTRRVDLSNKPRTKTGRSTLRPRLIRVTHTHTHTHILAYITLTLYRSPIIDRRASKKGFKQCKTIAVSYC